MPDYWYLILCLRIGLTLAALRVCHPGLAWFHWYLKATLPSLVLWMARWHDGIVWYRPVCLLFQVVAIAHAIAVPHWGDLHYRKRIGFSMCCLVASSAALVWVTPYAGFPAWLFWVQLATNAFGVAAIASLLCLMAYWRPFRPNWLYIKHMALLLGCCGVGVAGLVIPIKTREQWLALEIASQSAQCVLLGLWMTLCVRSSGGGPPVRPQFRGNRQRLA